MIAELSVLPWSIKCLLIRLHFNNNNVRFTELPTITSLLPQIENKGDLYMSANVTFRAMRLRQRISVWKTASLDIGDNVFLNDGVNICSTTNICIGSHTKIGDQTYIYDSDFHQISPDTPIRQSPVTIGRNVWIGANSMVLAGASIGDNSVIAAGSVVTGSIPANCLAAGSPARVIRKLAIPDGWVRP